MFEKISIVVPLGFARYYELWGSNVKTLIPMLVMLIIGAVSVIMSYRKLKN